MTPPPAWAVILLDVLWDGLETLGATLWRGGEFEPGEHLKVLYPGYSHHGIYAGFDRVIHFSKEFKVVEKVTLSQFRDDDRHIWVAASPRTFSADEIVERARSKVGQTDYHLFENNCEHFCNWCRSGRAHSRQVERWLNPKPKIQPKHACRVIKKLRRK